MKYDLFLTATGEDDISVALAVMTAIQRLTPVAELQVTQARAWMTHLPMLLRRGVSREEADETQQQFADLGAQIERRESRLLFPEDTPGMTRWRNEWFSEHLLALHELPFAEWAQQHTVQEAYRFSYLPSLGLDSTVCLWSADDTLHGRAQRSIGRLGPLPGPPGHTAHWSPPLDAWVHLQQTMQTHAFWESDSWNTVPDGYIVLDSNHWIVEGWRDEAYHVLVDQTPNDGAAREVGLLLLDALPDDFPRPTIE